LNYKFLHKDGYEAVIKDVDAFIGYVNAEAISESTTIFDEDSHVGKKAKEVSEFNEIFRIMKTNGWSVYSLSKPVEKNVSIHNIGLVDISKPKDDAAEQVHFGKEERKHNKKIENVEDENIRKKIVSKSNFTLNLSNSIGLFLTIASVLLILMSIIMVIISAKNMSYGNLNLSGNILWKRLGLSVGSVLVISLILRKFFLKGNFVVLMCSAVLIFTISAVQFVSSVEHMRSKTVDRSKIVESIKP